MKRIPKPLPIAEITSSVKKRDVLDKLADVQQALNDGLYALSNEIKKLRIKSHMNELSLSEREIKTLTEGVKALLMAERQQLEATKATDLTKKINDMSDAELLELAQSVLKIEKKEGSNEP